MGGERSADGVGGAPIRFAGGTANMDLVWRAARAVVDDGRNARADVIEVVSKAVTEGSGRSFLAT